MSVVAAVHSAAHQIAEQHTPTLRSTAVTNGLSAELAETLVLIWDGQSFVAKSTDPRMFDAEYGDGTQPARTPIRKALNQLRPIVTKQVSERVDAVAVPTVRF